MINADLGHTPAENWLSLKQESGSLFHQQTPHSGPAAQGTASKQVPKVEGKEKSPFDPTKQNKNASPIDATGATLSKGSGRLLGQFYVMCVVDYVPYIKLYFNCLLQWGGGYKTVQLHWSC